MVNQADNSRADGTDPVLDRDALRLLAAALQPDTRVGILSGAGISAASGVPTFRGQDGLWKQYRADDLATPEAFARDPRLVWDWYAMRRKLIRAARPNAAHLALGELARHVGQLSLLTQNVDGLHQLALEQAGLAGLVEVIELHGNLWRMRCTGCSRVLSDTRSDLLESLPFCACGRLLRPDVVWFGEQLNPQLVSRAAAIAGDCEVFLVVGTASVVQPAASYARLAALGNAVVAEINLEATSLSGSVPVSLRGRAEVVLPALVEAVLAAR